MKLAEGIRKHGFRKWYERELLQSHAHLLLTFLCMIGLFAAFEALGRFRSLPAFEIPLAPKARKTAVKTPKKAKRAVKAVRKTKRAGRTATKRA